VALHLDLIDAGDLIAWMQEPVGELAVICEEQEALGVVVEPPDGEEPGRSRRQEIRHDGAAFGVAETRDVAARLVEKHVCVRLARADGPAVEGDEVGRGVRLGAGLEPHRPVDGDAAGLEERLSPAA